MMGLFVLLVLTDFIFIMDFVQKFKTVAKHIANKQEIVKSVILVTSTRKKAVKC